MDATEHGDETATLLMVVAHPDDETFGGGSILLHAAARGARTVVVCATRGEAGEVTPEVALPAGGLAELREAELRSAATALGVDAVELWDLQDSGIDGDPAPGTLAAAAADRPEDLAAAVADAVRRHRPTVVATLDGSDGHRDHAAVRDAVLECLADGDVPLYLAGLARSLMHAWVLHHAEDPHTAAYTGLPEIGRPDESFTTVLDTSEHYAERCAAIALHRSQRSPFEGLPEELHRAFLTRDHFVRVVPAWTGGEQEDDLLGLRPT